MGMSHATLKDCPFCGSSDMDFYRGLVVGNRPDNGMRFVRCLGCGASTSWRRLDDAITAWNRRVGDT